MSNESPSEVARGNWLEKGRNDEWVKDVADVLLSKRGSLAVGEVRL
jgi:hypothetical protein